MDEHLSKEYKSPIPIEDLKEFPKGRNLMVVGNCQIGYLAYILELDLGNLTLEKRTTKALPIFFDGHAFLRLSILRAER